MTELPTDVPAAALTAKDLRRKRVDRTPVLWRRMGVIGTVERVARDGSWADMVWTTGSSFDLIERTDASWTKRQPLDRIEEWEHA